MWRFPLQHAGGNWRGKVVAAIPGSSAHHPWWLPCCSWRRSHPSNGLGGVPGWFLCPHFAHGDGNDPTEPRGRQSWTSVPWRNTKQRQLPVRSTPSPAPHQTPSGGSQTWWLSGRREEVPENQKKLKAPSLLRVATNTASALRSSPGGNFPQ